MRYRALALFNCLGADTAGRGEIRERVPFFDGYRQGDQVCPSAFPLTLEAADDDTALAEVWRLLNEDARSNRASERSLSIGDLVVLRGSEGNDPRCYAVDLLGFDQVAFPAGLQFPALDERA
jgi:hypothetical protein